MRRAADEKLQISSGRHGRREPGLHFHDPEDEEDEGGGE